MADSNHITTFTAPCGCCVVTVTAQVVSNGFRRIVVTLPVNCEYYLVSRAVDILAKDFDRTVELFRALYSKV